MPVKKQSFVKGAMILTASTVVVKVMGMLYKIPLGNILGAVGMSYFMTAYNIFNPVYALSVAGFPVAVSKMVAESYAKQSFRETKKIFRCSFALFIITGTAGFAAMFWGAGAAASLVDNPEARLAIMAMAPAIFFCCIVSAYRGYYQGLANMTPTAVSQILESFFRFICGVAFAVILLRIGMDGFESDGLVFGQRAASRSEAEFLALPWASAGAILGVTVSSVISAAYLALRHAFGGDGVTGEMLAASPVPPQSKNIIKKLSIFALPVCLGSVLTQITSLIDVATIMNRTAVAIKRDSGVVLGMYAGVLPAEITLEAVPRFLYGAYSYCSSLFNLVPALTIPLGISALPLISAQWAVGYRGASAKQAQSVIKMSSLIAIPAGLGLCALAEPVLALLYPARIQEVAIAAPLLRSLGIAAALVGITAPIGSVFQAAGRADIPVKIMAAGAALKIVMNYFLLAVPALNINAAPYGTILCYLFIFTASLLALQKVTGIEIDLSITFFKPLFCGIICAVAAHTSYGLLNRLISSRFLCLLSVGIGGIIHIMLIVFLRIMTKNEILLVPYGKKLQKCLKNYFF